MKMPRTDVSSLPTIKDLPIYYSNLKELIENNCVYVDKTQHIYELVRKKGLYFLSRPRRFGKSLLISTFEELFSGNKKLFEGLWIGSSDYNWQEHSVIHLDFSRINRDTAEELKINLLWKLKSIAQSHNINADQAPSISAALELLVKKLAKKSPVVILIDEYDKPILDHLQNAQEAHKQRAVLSGFYSTIKSLDQYLHFVFLTGVSKFAKTSIFSGMNNLNDISLDPIAARLLGYTQEEISHYFMPYIEDFARHENKLVPEILNKLRTWYNGYRFSKQDVKVYNPFSFLYVLSKQEFSNYWFQSATPTFLISLMQEQYESFASVKEIELSQDDLNTFEIDSLPLIPILFQTGYLTIANYDEVTGDLKLVPPNFEVEQSFTRFSIAALAETNTTNVNAARNKLTKALEDNDIDQFCSALENLFSHIPYSILRESYYHALLHLTLKYMSLDARSEIMTNTGRIDLVIFTKDKIFLFELKLNAKPEIALEQIKDKKYYQPYLMHNKPILLVGLSFIKKKKSFHVEHVEDYISN